MEDFFSDKAIALAMTLLSMLILSFMPFNPVLAQPEDLSRCKFEIIGGPTDSSPRMYPGQHAVFLTNITASNYTWTVEGPIIKDYDDDVYRSDDLTASANLENPTYMSPVDFNRASIEFYWGKSDDSNRTITVTVQTSDGTICKDSRSIIVARNLDDTNLQAEDFYVEKNHRMGLGNDTRVLKQHENWHRNYSYSEPSYVDNGDLFFDFHKNYIAHFDLWRTTFGYDNVTAWNPGSELPSGIDVDHAKRRVNETHPYVPRPLPLWFSHEGVEGDGVREVTTYDMIYPPELLQQIGLNQELLKWMELEELDEEYLRLIGVQGRENLIGVPIACEIFDLPSASSQYPRQQNALIDFEPDQELLGCALTHPYHNSAHYRIGGELGSATTAPKDPIFWRLHKFIDDVSVNP